MSSKPKLGLASFMAPVAESVKPVKAAPQADDIVALTFRMPRSMWEQVVMFTTVERTKIQPYLLDLIKQDFAKRGLRTK